MHLLLHIILEKIKNGRFCSSNYAQTPIWSKKLVVYTHMYIIIQNESLSDHKDRLHFTT